MSSNNYEKNKLKVPAPRTLDDSNLHKLSKQARDLFYTTQTAHTEPSKAIIPELIIALPSLLTHILTLTYTCICMHVRVCVRVRISF